MNDFEIENKINWEKCFQTSNYIYIIRSEGLSLTFVFNEYHSVVSRNSEFMKKMEVYNSCVFMRDN